MVVVDISALICPLCAVDCPFQKWDIKAKKLSIYLDKGEVTKVFCPCWKRFLTPNEIAGMGLLQ